MSEQPLNWLRFTGHNSLTHRLVLSTLTGRPIHVSRIRPSSPTNPGLAPHEVAFLQLLDTITNGSELQISLTGTTITYKPGLISGSKTGLGAGIDGCIEFSGIPDNNTRGISWFLLPLCILAPFSQGPVNVRFSGPGVITAATEKGDMSVDSIRTAILPLYEHFGILSAKLELRVLQRSCAGPGGRGGGGIVELRFGSQVRLPKTLHLNRSPGRIKRIRGVAYCTGVSASNNTRMIHSARGVLNSLVTDVHLASQYDQAPLVPEKNDPTKKRRTGIGFGLSLVAESSAWGVIYSADVVSPSTGGVTPEDLGKQCAFQLLETIERGGCTASPGAPTILMLMAMGSQDIGRLRLGRSVLGTEEVIGLGRDLKQFGASSWGLRDVDEDKSDDIIVSVKGTGVGNVGKKIA